MFDYGDLIFVKKWEEDWELGIFKSVHCCIPTFVRKQWVLNEKLVTIDVVGLALGGLR